MRHACSLDELGQIECWGIDIGNSIDKGQVTETPIAGTYTQVDAGGYLTCALDSSNLLSCWGLYDVQNIQMKTVMVLIPLKIVMIRMHWYHH